MGVCQERKSLNASLLEKATSLICVSEWRNERELNVCFHSDFKVLPIFPRA